MDDQKTVITAAKAGGLVFVNLVIAIVLPLLLDYFKSGLFNLSEEIIIGFLVIITLTLSEAFIYIYLLNSRSIQQLDVWQSKSDIDSLLNDIRYHMHKLIDNSEIQDKFFLEHYRYEIKQLKSWLQNTITKNEIPIERNHIEATDTLLAIYDRKSDDTFLASHLLWETGDNFDVTYQFYFNAWIKKIKENNVQQLNRLFIYRTKEDFKIPLARKLVAFHNNHIDGLNAKAIARSELNRFKKDFHITDGVEDFGIFSDLYLYLGSSRNAEQISGIFSRDKERIMTYINMFNALWNSHAAKSLDKYVSDVVTEEQLFDSSFILNEGTTNPTPGQPHE